MVILQNHILTVGTKETTRQASFFLIWWNKKSWFELAEVLMESKLKDHSGVVHEEHKGHGQDSHWEGRKFLNSLTMTKWWEMLMLSEKKSSSHPSVCLIPDRREHSFLWLLVWELWLCYIADLGTYFSQKCVLSRDMNCSVGSSMVVSGRPPS